MRTQIQTINDNARLNQWIQIIQEYRSSGLSVRNWRHQYDVSEASYYLLFEEDNTIDHRRGARIPKFSSYRLRRKIEKGS